MTKFETLYQITGLKDDRQYSSWSDWEACSVTCGNGTTKRTRTCTDGQYGGVACVGSTMETEETAICNDFDCPDCKLFESFLPICEKIRPICTHKYLLTHNQFVLRALVLS